MSIAICDICKDSIRGYDSYLIEKSTKKMYCFECTWGDNITGKIFQLIDELGVDEFNEQYFYYTDG